MSWGAPSWRDGYLDRNYAVRLLCVSRRGPNLDRRAQLCGYLYQVLALDWYRWQVAR